MASHPARTPLGLFDNPVRVFSLDELAATVRKLERERPGRTVEELGARRAHHRASASLHAAEPMPG
jgi:hypothetical protein